MALIWIICIIGGLYALLEWEEKRFNDKQKKDANSRTDSK